MNCKNCGSENPAGAKFCQECGTSLPQVKNCISCGAELPLESKFCLECGTKQEIESGEDLSTTGINMGDKNVIAGDVVSNVTNNTQVHHNEQITNNVTNNVTNSTTNNTTIINQDDTKKVVSCDCCGRSVLITESYKCNKCSKTVCKDCFDIDAAVCYLCSPNKRVTKIISSEVQEFIDKVKEYDAKLLNLSKNRKMNFDTSSLQGFGKSFFKSIGSISNVGKEMYDIDLEKEHYVNDFTPPRTKRAFNDSILFMETQRDSNKGQPVRLDVNWDLIWSKKISSLISQANILFGDDADFMESLRKHESLAKTASSNMKLSLSEKMWNLGRGMF